MVCLVVHDELDSAAFVFPHSQRDDATWLRRGSGQGLDRTHPLREHGRRRTAGTRYERGEALCARQTHGFNGDLLTFLERSDCEIDAVAGRQEHLCSHDRSFDQAPVRTDDMEWQTA